MVDKILHVQKMCNHCTSSYHSEFMRMFDEVIMLDEYSVKKYMKKDVKKSSVSKTNQ